MFKDTVENIRAYTPEISLDQLKQRYGLKNIVRLSANENPFGTSPMVKTAVLNWNFDQARAYPDSNAENLRQAVARFQKVAPEQLLFGCGLDEVIELIARTFLEPGDEVLEPWPTFSEYKLHATIENATVIDIPVNTENGQFDLTQMRTKITSKTKLIWLCNPNNPTGTYLPTATLAQFIAQVPKDILILVDEAYIEFTTAEANASAISLLNQYDNLIVLRTFSKIYGLANFRVGYAVIPKALIGKMQAVRLPYNLNDLSQLAARVALKDQAFVIETRARIARSRQDWQIFLTQKGLKFYPSQANFIFFEAPNALQLKETLLQNGYLVRSGLQQDWLRVTFGTTAQNKAIQEIIQTFYD